MMDASESIPEQAQPELPPNRWPSFMGMLEHDLSESPVVAPVPPDLVVNLPSQSVPVQIARWSGIWSGWAGNGRNCDVKLIVESATQHEACIVCSRASVQHGSFSERLTARFEGNELRATLSNGADVSFRMRNDHLVELIWRDSDRHWVAGVLAQGVALPQRITERVETGLYENGAEVTLEMVIFKPVGPGPFPTLIVNHGSTGEGNDPSLFSSTWTSPELARFFIKRGWMVAFPQRRGRGKSGGIYDEGFERDRSRYSSDPELSLAGVERALADVDASVAHLLKRTDVDRTRILISGTSRGGILAVAYAGTRPSLCWGVINFVGGWVDGKCASAAAINTNAFRRGASYGKATLWLYADNDPFYTLDHSRNNFEDFLAAGGKGSFHVVKISPNQDGHHIISMPDLWGLTVDRYISQAV